MMPKQKLQARVRYDKHYVWNGGEHEAYVVETYDPEFGWCLSSAYALQAKAGETECNYVHFSLISKMAQLMALGYEVTLR